MGETIEAVGNRNLMNLSMSLSVHVTTDRIYLTLTQVYTCIICTCILNVHVCVGLPLGVYCVDVHVGSGGEEILNERRVRERRERSLKEGEI